MSNIVIPNQEHQIEALQQPSGKSEDKGSKNTTPNVVLPTQDHQFKAFEQGGKEDPQQISNLVIPDKEQLKAFETENKDEDKKSDGEVRDTQFNTSVYNLLTSSKNGIFSKYTRQFKDLSDKLDNDSAELIIFSPTDSAIESLSAKPWEFPAEVTASNDAKDEVSNSNIRNFLGSHIVDSKGKFKRVAEGKGVTLKTINGNELELVNADNDFKVIIAGSVVAKVSESQIVGNGVLLTVDQPLDWPGK